MKKSIICPLFGCKQPPSDKTREMILTQAKKFFADVGYEGASLRDICNAAKANVSAVKYHFGDKEGLYRTCLSEYAESRLAITDHMLTPVNTLEELKIKLHLFAEEFINASLNDFDMSRMIFREIENMNPIMEGIFEGSFLKIFKQITLILLDAQNKKLIDTSINVETTASMFFHYLSQSVRTHHIALKFFKRDLKNPETQKEHIDHFLHIIIHGIKPQEKI